jgi:hypothetical protein
MIVYLPGSPDKPPGARHFMSVCPAGHLPVEYNLERDGGKWWDRSTIPPRPQNFNFVFEGGECNVTPQAVAEYMVSTGLVVKKRPVFRYLFQ